MNQLIPHSIKFIFFDVGGVLVKDFSNSNKWDEMLNDLKLQDNQRKRFTSLFDEYEYRLCTGMTCTAFQDIVTRDCGFIFPSNYSLLHDLVARFEPNPEIASLVKKQQGIRRIGLLTNMYPGMLSLIKKSNVMPDVSWDVVIDSSEVEVAKPEQEIFKIAEKMAGVNPQEILFLENIQRHIRAAEKRGWKTVFIHN